MEDMPVLWFLEGRFTIPLHLFKMHNVQPFKQLLHPIMRVKRHLLPCLSAAPFVSITEKLSGKDAARPKCPAQPGPELREQISAAEWEREPGMDQIKGLRGPLDRLEAPGRCREPISHPSVFGAPFQVIDCFIQAIKGGDREAMDEHRHHFIAGTATDVATMAIRWNHRQRLHEQFTRFAIPGDLEKV